MPKKKGYFHTNFNFNSGDRVLPEHPIDPITPFKKCSLCRRKIKKWHVIWGNALGTRENIDLYYVAICPACSVQVVGLMQKLSGGRVGITDFMPRDQK